ncbi:MAG TPA: energy transducer TonB [Sphingomicrobium sp.]|jgi:TonB family protein
MGEPLQAFDQCARDSLKDWGVDPDLQEKIVRPLWAAASRNWIGADDYPTKLAVQGEESTVAIRLLVDATGKPTKCTSLTHYREKEFNEITCAKAMERLRFEPAELSDGTKVPSYYTQHITFRLMN